MTTEQGFVDADQPMAQTIIDKVNTMGMDNLNDKVNINVGDGGGGGMGMAALIAAMNSGGGDNNLPGLIAALGNNNRGIDPGIAAMLANRGNDGMNNLWPIILLALLGRGRGGLLGGGGDDCPIPGASPAQVAMLQSILNDTSATRASVPTTALETQNALQSALASLALGTQQGFANTGDKVTNTGTAVLGAVRSAQDTTQAAFALLARDLCDVKSTVMAQGCETRELVQAGTTAVLQKIDQNTIDELRARADRAERQVEINALRSQVEVNQTVTTTQAQGQQQGQVQFQLQDIGSTLRAVANSLALVHQEQRSTNSVINAGNVGASTIGAQTSTPTQINARG